MELSLEKEMALIEAVLYLESEPIDEKLLGKITGLGDNVLEAALEKLKERFLNDNSGLEIIRLGGGISIAPKKEYWEQLKERYGKKNEAKLSRAAMETLSIIAYKQPITRSEIEAIRGVSADNMIRILVEKDLVCDKGKKEIPGHPIQFGTTDEFLHFFRLESLDDLPKLNKNEAEQFELNG
jgi:segregation and condensation protein B